MYMQCLITVYVYCQLTQRGEVVIPATRYSQRILWPRVFVLAWGITEQHQVALELGPYLLFHRKCQSCTMELRDCLVTVLTPELLNGEPGAYHQSRAERVIGTP